MDNKEEALETIISCANGNAYAPENRKKERKQMIEKDLQKGNGKKKY